ncbi:MAG TPA: glutamate formimidoyltransferase [Methylomirabilota bacterium]
MVRGPIVECVPNVSEGRDPARLGRLAGAVTATPGVRLANVHADPDHHRSVFTFLGPPGAVAAGALALADAVVTEVDMRQHHGIHPRIGALDVLPFVPLAGTTMAEAVALAHATGRALAARHALPVYYYGHAARRPERRALRELRHGEYEGLAARLASADGRPDDGPARFDARAGAVLIGARDVLIAYNVWLATGDLAVARAIARSVRTSGGGLPAVQALGLPLASRGRVQVSMNLLDYRVTPIPAVFDRVREGAARAGHAVDRAELVGLAPRAALGGRSPASVGLDGLGAEAYLDTWLGPDHARD